MSFTEIKIRNFLLGSVFVFQLILVCMNWDEHFWPLLTYSMFAYQEKGDVSNFSTTVILKKGEELKTWRKIRRFLHPYPSDYSIASFIRSSSKERSRDFFQQILSKFSEIERIEVFELTSSGQRTLYLAVP